ncbi:MAG: glycerol kinase GlpK [Gammaproteobacteria bacterium]|nr:glycerol kinase GlpK [Gammaproteobacteria bacterium]
MTRHILAIDQGTTSSRAIVFNPDGQRLGSGQEEFPQLFPQNGWVEHNPEDIWQTTLNSCKLALRDAGLMPQDITTIGITNQRETSVVWDRATGKPVYNAIVWQDRRTADYCNELKDKGLETAIQNKTGLLLDPYFSASKISWILENVAGAREKAERGELAFGTIDSFLLWRLTGGKRHSTDATNAARTMLYNIREQRWDPELLKVFAIPESMLPEVLDCAAEFGQTSVDVLGCEIPIQGIAGDQQAAAFGQCCFQPGMAKSTYGTGCFLLLNTGSEALLSANRLLTTPAYRLGGETTFAIEGSIFMAGATMQWIRDGLKLIQSAAESEVMAKQTDDELDVYLVPAFTGLGAPYWDPDARGAIYGLTRDTGVKEIVTAALLSVCYQSRDLLQAIQKDGASFTTIRVDGGMVANNFMLQGLADLLNCQVDRPEVIETTALGAAYLAGLQAGIFDSLGEISERWSLERSFLPLKDESWRQQRYAGWLDAVERTRSVQKPGD